MKRRRILILESDVVTRMALEGLLTELGPVAVVTHRTVAGAKEVQRERFDFAFLDVRLADGETFGLARSLAAHGVPFAFMVDDVKDVPPAWRDYPVISKPARLSAVRQVLQRAEDCCLVA